MEKSKYKNVKIYMTQCQNVKKSKYKNVEKKTYKCKNINLYMKNLNLTFRAQIYIRQNLDIK